MQGVPPDAWIAAVRAVHFAAAIVLFGQFAFAAFVATDGQPAAHFRRVAAWSLIALAASAAAWLALEASAMSGLPAKEALSPGTLATVLGQTQFGRVWLARMAISFLLIGVLALSRERTAVFAGGILSALLLAGIAGMGHGGGGRGAAGALHFAVDAVHLLAAGAWLGALVPLIVTLRAAARGDDALRRRAAQTTRRFSTLGILSMVLIVASGVANTCTMLSSLSDFVASPYGRLLYAKIVLFLVILVIAATNRLSATPRLAEGGKAFQDLSRNAIVECLLGLAIVAIVGELGITIPAGHHANMRF